jgi:hypothetical protein
MLVRERWRVNYLETDWLRKLPALSSFRCLDSHASVALLLRLASYNLRLVHQS